ncbi:glutaredoxin-like [Acanthaster planci]|uniref:Glutaredoxin-2, mitochondrial n=1 Tax=Acanthaster planci TaxID=133434 RepID=A0A8B7Y9U3_ACAPL|nr:glutaredoxin-like [Acanthaster planci]XP_022089146.1 glutaredoxin-like [Acanthaster planci]XP_022089147.1 glutaredoxin-like [Acanthaster planci]XP_022089148.1 glutaredoxin-like [Acanthaster planci]
MGNWFSPIPDVPLDSPEGKLVEQILHDKIVVVFSKTYCPYCTMAKNALDEHNANYETVELDKREDGKRIQSVLGKMTGAMTVPQVFIKGKFIGGGTEVKQLNDEGKLEEMLREAGAI